eukprot:13133460-Alexandrium_andersonii.AAC.1
MKPFQSPAVVYADYLESEHWAADRNAEVSSSPLFVQPPVREEADFIPFTEAELAAALDATKC